MGDRSSKLRSSATALLAGGVRRRPAQAPGPALSVARSLAERVPATLAPAARAELAARARELGPWAQGPFPLGGDLVVGERAGSERAWQAIAAALGGALTGRTVLDVGSGAGHRAFAAMLAGAGHVVATEAGAAHEQAVLLESRYALGVHLHRRDWWDLHHERDGRFNVVICQDGLAGELHPALLLERLRALLTDDGVLVLGAVALAAPSLEGMLAATGLGIETAIEIGPAGADRSPVALIAHARPPGVAPYRGPGAAARFPPGFYYSPLPDTAELAGGARHEQVWPASPRETPGIDWREADQVALCDRFAGQQRLAFPDEPGEDPTEYFISNGQYPALDAWILEAMLRHLRPARMIEVGSGFSSLVSARVNREQLEGSMALTCIEPYPRDFLRTGVEGIDVLRIEQIQDTPLEVFAALGRDDVLFIDTSHCVKTGGDVPWIFHEILPRLAGGVVVHIHDAFLPGDYPIPWVMEGWGWNERYLIQSFLAFNSAYRVELGAQYMLQRHPAALAAAFPGLAAQRDRTGASLWLRRV